MNSTKPTELPPVDESCCEKGSSVNLHCRNRQPELMDQLGLDETLHRQALVGLRTVNRFSRSGAIVWPEIRRLAGQSRERPLRVLDVASGGGDVAVWVAGRAAAAGVQIEIDGCDISPVAVAHANEYAETQMAAHVRFFEFDVMANTPAEQYDVVMCSLFLHHFDESNATLLLNRFKNMARQRVLINDLRRTRLGYQLAWLGCRLLTQSPIARTDGLLSVAAAFTPQEARTLAERAGLADVRIELHWPQRFLLSARPGA